MSGFGPLVSTDWLLNHRRDPDVRVLDVRWMLHPEWNGPAHYRAGHIPGAVFLDVDRDLSAPGGKPGGPLGRHPWPSAEQVERVMGAAGVGDATRVVAYDDSSGSIAARVWYLLRAFGHEDVAVLDGGLRKWVDERGAMETAEPAVAPAPVQARPAPGAVLTQADLLAWPPGALVLDARAPERFRGDSEPIDTRAGHIPGAHNAPFAANLVEAYGISVFRPPEELKAQYAALGADREPPVVYCGSGVTACHDLIALELAGLKGRLYAGPWSEWSSDPKLPIETGEPKR